MTTAKDTEQPRSMEEIRADAVQRVIDKLKNRDVLRAFVNSYENTPPTTNPGRHDFDTDIVALVTLARSTAERIEEDIHDDIGQIAFLIARDVIGDSIRSTTFQPDGRAPGERQAVNFITTNRYMPPLRDIQEVEAIWQVEDAEDQYAAALMEAIHDKCAAIEIMLACPDYDNAVYAVDLREWEHTGEESDDLNDEWVRSINEPPSKVTPEPTNWRADIEALNSVVDASSGTDIRFTVGDRVKFVQPNTDTEVHTITSAGRDSDLDVWVKIDDDATAIYDWATILVPAS